MNYSPKIWIPVASACGLVIGISLSWFGLVPSVFLPKATSLPPASSSTVSTSSEQSTTEDVFTTTTEVVRDGGKQQVDETEVRLAVDWLPVMQDVTADASKILASMNASPNEFSISTDDRYIGFDSLWLMGQVSDSAYAGSKVYLLNTWEFGLGIDISSFIVFVPTDDSLPRAFLPEADIQGLPINGQIILMPHARFVDPEPPAEMHLENGRLITKSSGTFGLDRRQVEYDSQKTFKEQELIGKTLEGFTYVQTSSSFPGIQVMSRYKKIFTYYAAVPGAISLQQSDAVIPAVQWTDGKVRRAAYNFHPTSGCGSSPGPKIVPESSINLSELRSVGTMDGDRVYTPRNPAAFPRLIELYDQWYVPDGKAKPSIDIFLSTVEYPLLFWKNGLGQWVELSASVLIPAAECGKPVIYLYPPEATPVSVRLPSFIDVTVSEPLYPKAGWQVVAQPDGQLQMTDGNMYDSLFWEGTGVTYDLPHEGFILKDGEVDARLQELLARYGLNQKESQDFRDFWVPRMIGAPYYRVTFLTDVWSKAAPLAVSPRPTTSVRLFMDWQRLRTPIDLPEPIVQTPRRDGFTLVEWGGLLR